MVNCPLAAIFLAIELFDREYIEMLGSLGPPVLSVDGAADASYTPMQCDFILMESLSSITSLTSQVIAAGARRLGFVGDARHCCSFHERWMGFCSTLERAPGGPQLLHSGGRFGAL